MCLFFFMQPNSTDKSDQQSDSDALSHCRSPPIRAVVPFQAEQISTRLVCSSHNSIWSVWPSGGEMSRTQLTTVIPQRPPLWFHHRGMEPLVGFKCRRIWAPWVSVLVFSVFHSWQVTQPARVGATATLRYLFFPFFCYFSFFWCEQGASLCFVWHVSPAELVLLSCSLWKLHSFSPLVSLLMFQDFIAFPTGSPVRQTDSYKSSSNNLLGSCKRPQLSFISLLYSFMTIQWSCLRVAPMAERDRRIPY